MDSSTPLILEKQTLAPRLCRSIINLACEIGFEEGKIGDGDIAPDTRNNSVVFLTPQNFGDHEQLYEHLWRWVRKVNGEFFQFNLLDVESVQVSRYCASNREHYGWHVDQHLSHVGDHQRKLSCSMLLNDASEFDGGDIEFRGIQNRARALSGSGDMVFFPSFLEHRVNPVTRGVRYSLVAWFHGPRWV